MATTTRATIPADLARTATIHRAQLPHGLFPELGERFLRAYHRSYLDSPHAVARVATADDEVVGFIVGTVDEHTHRDWVLRNHGIRLALWGLLGLVTHPRTLWWFLRTRVGRYLRAVLRAARGSRGASTSAAGDDTTAVPDAGSGATPTIGVLTHVAVDPAARGLGLGARLTREFTAAAHERGSTEVRLVTRADGGAGGFYEALGWQRSDERGRDGAAMLEYRMPSPDSPDTPAA